jgi:diguanylate cyclase (GGDEF)-like protein
MAFIEDPIRLLLIQNRPGTVDLVRKSLDSGETETYAVQAVSDLATGLERLAEHPVDVVMFELGVSYRSGLVGIRRLAEAFPGIPVVALVETRDPKVVGQARAAGALDHLMRGRVDAELWSRVIHNASEMGRLRRQLQFTRAEKELMSFMDPLTGLLNRQGVEYSLLREVRRCQRDNIQLMALLIDLDDSARIQDPHKPDLARQVIKEAARRIVTTLRTTDEVGRTGDWQFLVLLPNARLAEGMLVAQRIRQAIADDQFRVGENVLPVTARLGLFPVSARASSAEEVLERACRSLERSHNIGPDRVFYVGNIGGQEVPQPVVIDTRAVEKLIREDLVHVARQPILRLADEQPVAEELLIRGPEGPLHCPHELLRLGIETEVQTPLDMHCLRRCVTAVREEGAEGIFHVNIMPTTLMEVAVERLVEFLNDGRSAARFCLELSEQQFLGDPAYLIGRVRQLREAGIKIALDDVGVGFGALESIVLLRPDYIKIDRKLVRGVANDFCQLRNLRRLMQVARALSVEIIAVGIENANDLQVLRECRLEYGQGYHFGRPKVRQRPDQPDKLAGLWSWLCTLDRSNLRGQRS